MDPPQVEKAVDALLTHVRNGTERSLTDTDSKIMAQVGFKMVPAKPKHNIRLTLAHSMYPKDPKICLITKDPQRFFKDLVKTHDLPITKVLEISKLRKRHKEFEAKRILCDSYDVFLADDRIIPIIPRWFGSYFYKKGKAPIKVDLTKKNLKAEIDTAIKSFMLTGLGKGSNISIPCGHVSFDNEQLNENIASALDDLTKKVKPGWKNIKSVHIKSEASVSLPIYNALEAHTIRL